jgi:hypothetical protein
MAENYWPGVLLAQTLCAAAPPVAALSTGTTLVSTGEVRADERQGGIDEWRCGELILQGKRC